MFYKCVGIVSFIPTKRIKFFIPSNEMPILKFIEEFELIVAFPENVSLSKLNALNDLLFAVIDDIIKKVFIFS